MGKGILATIGRTPLVALERLFVDAPFELHAKLEGFNPSGSVKDRPALALVESAMQAGLLLPGGTVVESSSGNLGIGLAQVCRYLSLNFRCVVDPKTTSQNLAILRAYGAVIEMVREPDPATGEFLPARIRRVRELCESIPGSYWPDQYSNMNNARAHHATMKEIVEQLGQAPDYLLCAAGSCGTLRGCAEYLRSSAMHTQVIAVDAVGSAIFGHPPAKRLIPGHGSAIVPRLLDRTLISRCVHVTDAECVQGCRLLLQTEAILAGGSAGAVVSALCKIRHEIPANAKCVLVLCDRGERYLDTIFDNEWAARLNIKPGAHASAKERETINAPAEYEA